MVQLNMCIPALRGSVEGVIAIFRDAAGPGWLSGGLGPQRLATVWGSSAGDAGTSMVAFEEGRARVVALGRNVYVAMVGRNAWLKVCPGRALSWLGTPGLGSGLQARPLTALRSGRADRAPTVCPLTCVL